MVQEIAPVVQECLETFTGLTNGTFSLSTTGIPKVIWQDELGRFRIWAANIGAHRTGQSSLAFRLHDASQVREQVLRVLNGMKQDFEDLDATISDQFAEEQSTVLEEAEEVFRAIQASINRLFDISMIIRKPVHGDALRGAIQESVGLYDQIDQQHVCDKFPSAESSIQDRLAAAITQRRKELKYYERHRQKLGRGMDYEESDPSDRSSTAPSCPLQADSLIPDDVEMSDMSYTSSLPESMWTSDSHTRMPKRPAELKDGRSGECPYCYRIVAVKSDRSWAHHVFVDLKPYTCLSTDCSIPNRRYLYRRDWVTHMQEKHSKDGEWLPQNCPLCIKDDFHGVGVVRHIGRHLIDLALWALPRDKDDSEPDQQDYPASISINMSDLEQSSSEDELLDAATETHIPADKDREDFTPSARVSTLANWTLSNSDIEEIVTKSIQQADAVGDNQSEARGRSPQRASLTNTDQRGKVVNLQKSYAYENPQSAVAGSDSGRSPSRPKSSGYQWDYIPAYRLNKFSLEGYLRKLFGNWRFYISVCCGALE